MLIADTLTANPALNAVFVDLYGEIIHNCL